MPLVSRSEASAFHECLRLSWVCYQKGLICAMGGSGSFLLELLVYAASHYVLFGT